MTRQLICFVLIGGFASLPTLVQSQVNYEWQQPEPNVSSGEVAVYPGNCFENGFIVDVRGSTAYLYSAFTGAFQGSYSTGGEIESKPVIVKLKDGKWYVFITSSDGKLYKIDIAAAFTIAKTGGISQIVSIRRAGDSGCLIKDEITASPVVQLESESNSSYTLGKDIVLVATHHGCSSSTTNLVYAFDAADVYQPPVWVFNQFGDYAVDYFTNCILDIKRNAIFCCTNINAGHFQNTIWSLNTVTGNLNWAGNFSSVHSRPLLGNSVTGGLDHLYVANTLTDLYAINPDSGIEDWHLKLTSTVGSLIDKPLKIGQGEFAQEIMATTSEGKIYAVYDGGTNPGDGEGLWQYAAGGGIKVKTTCTPMGASGKCYADLDDGTIRQFDMATGANDATEFVYSGYLPPGSVNFGDLEIYNQGGYEYKMVQTAWGLFGNIWQYNIPSFAHNNPPILVNIWQGTIDSTWENPGNWSKNQVPDSTTDVLITCQGGAFVSTVNAVCHSLDLRNGATLIIKPGFKLAVIH